MTALKNGLEEQHRKALQLGLDEDSMIAICNDKRFQ